MTVNDLVVSNQSSAPLTRSVVVPPHLLNENPTLSRFISELTLIPVPSNPDRQVFYDLASRWVRIVGSIDGHPLYRKGMVILHALINRKDPITEFKTFGPPITSSPLKLSHVMTDYMITVNNLDETTDSDTGERLTLSKAERLAQMIELHGAEKWPAQTRMFNILTIPCTSSGVHSTNFDPVPHLSPNSSLIPKTSDPELFESSGTVSPPGAVSVFHSDTTICSQYMGHITGYKLWLFAPPTPSNVDYMYRHPHDGPRNEAEVAKMVENLQGLSYLIANDPVAFALPPGTLHCVLTFQGSSHVCVNFYDWNEVGTMEEKMRSAHDRLKSYGPEDDLHYLASGEAWECEHIGPFLEKNKKDPVIRGLKDATTSFIKTWKSKTEKKRR
jgi:hypothetical protein